MKQRWIQKHKADPLLDYDIVYKDDEEIHEQERMQFGYLEKFNTAGPDVRHKAQREWAQWHDQITDSEWDARFVQLLNLSLIDVSDDYYKDELNFKHADQLMEIF